MDDDTFFYGDGERGELPQPFIKKTTRVMLRNSTWSDEAKIKYFVTYLADDSVAENWFDNLADAEKATWDGVVKQFALKWPATKSAGKTASDLQMQLEEWRLTENELGTTREVDGKYVQAHIAWANKAEALANVIPDTNGLLIGATRSKLPPSIRALVTADFRSWKVFCDAVRGLSVAAIREQREREKEKETLKDAMARLARLQESPSKPLAASLGRMNVRVEPLRYSSAPPPRQTTPPAPAPYRGPAVPYARVPDADRLQTMENNVQTIHPATTAGRALYQAEITAWTTLNGRSFPNENRPYPLTPGSSPVASGECWKCGHQGHMAGSCTSLVRVPVMEEKWRSIAASIRSRARNMQQVNYVGELDDVGAEDDVAARIQEAYEQGKAEGSSGM